MKKTTLWFLGIFFTLNIFLDLGLYNSLFINKKAMVNACTDEKKALEDPFCCKYDPQNEVTNSVFKKFNIYRKVLVLRDVSIQLLLAVFLVFLLTKIKFIRQFKKKHKFWFLILHFLLYSGLFFSMYEMALFIRFNNGSYGIAKELFIHFSDCLKVFSNISSNINAIERLILKDVVYQFIIFSYFLFLLKLKEYQKKGKV
jgi:hypothetical protein